MKSSSPRRKRNRVTRLQPLLGTYVEIAVEAVAEESILQGWISAGLEAVKEIDQLMSYHRADSDLSRLNRAKPGSWVDVHPHTLKVLTAAQALFESSSGILDIRCGTALVAQGVLPMPSGHRSSRSTTTAYHSSPVEIAGTRVRKTDSEILDLGGIAKGYAVDRAVETIQTRAAGVRTSGVVNAGGDLRLWGKRKQALALRIHGNERSIQLPWTSGATAMATSSVRKNSQGKHAPAAHIYMPSGTRVRKAATATVFANECLWADALTKVVLIGPEEVAARCLALHHAKALVFGSDGQLGRALG